MKLHEQITRLAITLYNLSNTTVSTPRELYFCRIQEIGGYSYYALLPTGISLTYYPNGNAGMPARFPFDGSISPTVTTAILDLFNQRFHILNSELFRTHKQHYESGDYNEQYFS